MSIPPNSSERGCASVFTWPLNNIEELAREDLENCVYYYNEGAGRLPEIVYRSSSGNYDIHHHVFRWDTRNYLVVFQDGFQSRLQEQNIHDSRYFNLTHHVNYGGVPLDPSRRNITHPFVSTTLSRDWPPCSFDNGTVIESYRYEIYAPGGIWVAETFGRSYWYPNEDEVSFVGGIAPQYILSAQRFRLTGQGPGREAIMERVDTTLIQNTNFNPPWALDIDVRDQILEYELPNGTLAPLDIILWHPPGADCRRAKRSIDSDTTSIDWYANKVAKSESYAINAAFRSSRQNEAYLFMGSEYVLIEYAPGTKDDKVLNGPLLICKGFPSLTNTAFAEYGIDCAFGSQNTDEAFIFSGNLCARINFAPGTLNDKIIEGPMAIERMFPFLKGTVFESGIDAAFESTTQFEAYLFKDNQFALINYGSEYSRLIAVRLTIDGFVSLKNTIFESGIDAAFASHRTDEAYLFKGDSYALINFAPGTTNDSIVGGVKKIQPNWPALYAILPRKNHGLDYHDHTTTHDELPHDHDEL